MSDYKQQQHNKTNAEHARDLEQASALLSDLLTDGQATTGEIFTEAGLTIGTHSAILMAIIEGHKLPMSKDVVDALADSMLVGIELARRVGLKRDAANSN